MFVVHPEGMPTVGTTGVLLLNVAVVFYISRNSILLLLLLKLYSVMQKKCIDIEIQ